MKIIPSSLLTFAAIAALAPSAVCGDASNDKQVFHVQGPRELFESYYDANKASLDLWSSKVHEDGTTIEADLYASPSVVHQLTQMQGGGRALREGDDHSTRSFRVLAAAATTAELAAKEKTEVTTCHAATASYLQLLRAARESAFAASKLHDCWRTSTQVFEYLDTLVDLAPSLITKLPPIGKTFQGQEIPAYKISTSSSSSNKKALFGQGLIHAREWQSGSAVFYIISALLDALRANDPRVRAIFDKYDWYFVPILNVDGYDFTWTEGNRLWRKNRRTFTVDGKPYTGVDLNRNFGPVAFFDLTHDSQNPDNEIYPGTSVLSEPESAAVHAFLRALPSPLAGAIDVHMNSQTMIRPFSNQRTEAREPFRTKLIDLGDKMRRAIQTESIPYGNVMGGTGHYLAYGTFKDAIFQEFGNAPGYTLELERADGGFITSQTTIRDVGSRTLQAFLAFSEGIADYWSFNCTLA